MIVNISHEIDSDFLKLAIARYLEKDKMPDREKFILHLQFDIEERGSDPHSFFKDKWVYKYQDEADEFFLQWFGGVDED